MTREKILKEKCLVKNLFSTKCKIKCCNNLENSIRLILAIKASLKRLWRDENSQSCLPRGEKFYRSTIEVISTIVERKKNHEIPAINTYEESRENK